MTSRGDVRIGISGWRYEPWRGTFYPKGLAQWRELEYASRKLRTIEINGSFYSLQAPASYRMWYEATPDDFVFAVKGGRYITHMLRLLNVRAALGNFFASGIAELRHKLGPFLWQFPPNFAFDAERLEAFLAMLPYDTDAAAAVARRHDQKLKTRAVCVYKPPQVLRHAVEIRHPSFVDAAFIALLRRYNVAFVVADTARKWVEYEDVTADFVYMRLHGAVTLYQSRYTEQELVDFARKIDCWSRGREPGDARRISARRAPKALARDVYCYFDNTDKIEAPANAIRLAELAELGYPLGTSTLRLAM
jgi:uncharacterized protein YecE (DUF72 family)